MMVRTKGGIVQACPLTKHTTVIVSGSATTSMTNYDTLRFLEDNTSIEVQFNDDSLQTYPMEKGFDFAIGSDVRKITVTSGSILLG